MNMVQYILNYNTLFVILVCSIISVLCSEAIDVESINGFHEMVTNEFVNYVQLILSVCLGYEACFNVPNVNCTFVENNFFVLLNFKRLYDVKLYFVALKTYQNL